MEKNRIGMLRKELGLNQRELGIKLGVGQTTVSAWETGKNEPDMNALRAMSQLFDVSVEYLSGFEMERWPGGYKNQEYQTRIQRRMAEAEHEKMLREFEQQDRDEPTIEEIEALREHEVWAEWQKTDGSMFLEVFQINQMCEYMTESDRKRMLKIVQLAFPQAAQGKYEG